MTIRYPDHHEAFTMANEALARDVRSLSRQMAGCGLLPPHAVSRRRDAYQIELIRRGYVVPVPVPAPVRDWRIVGVARPSGPAADYGRGPGSWTGD